LQAFTSGSDPDEAPRIFLETAQGITQNDPFRGISNMFDRKAALTSDAENAQIGAWLCLIGAAVAGTVFYVTNSSTKGGIKVEQVAENNTTDDYRQSAVGLGATLRTKSDSIISKAAQMVLPKSTAPTKAAVENPGTGNAAKPQFSEQAKARLIGGAIMLIGIGIISGVFGTASLFWGWGVCLLGAGLISRRKLKL
jgi:hypothetical protein